MSRLKRDLILSAIDVTREKRDAAISTLIKAETKLRELRKQLERFDKRQAKLDRPANLEDFPVVSTTVEKMVDAWITPPPPPTDDLAIPDFLRRDRAEDAAVRAAIEAEVAERKRTKAQVRIEKLKAKQSGETRKLPLTGKDALRFIREGKR